MMPPNPNTQGQPDPNATPQGQPKTQSTIDPVDAFMAIDEKMETPEIRSHIDDMVKGVRSSINAILEMHQINLTPGAYLANLNGNSFIQIVPSQTPRLKNLQAAVQQVLKGVDQTTQKRVHDAIVGKIEGAVQTYNEKKDLANTSAVDQHQDMDITGGQGHGITTGTSTVPSTGSNSHGGGHGGGHGEGTGHGTPADGGHNHGGHGSDHRAKVIEKWRKIKAFPRKVFTSSGEILTRQNLLWRPLNFGLDLPGMMFGWRKYLNIFGNDFWMKGKSGGASSGGNHDAHH